MSNPCTTYKLTWFPQMKGMATKKQGIEELNNTCLCKSHHGRKPTMENAYSKVGPQALNLDTKQQEKLENMNKFMICDMPQAFLNSS